MRPILLAVMAVALAMRCSTHCADGGPGIESEPKLEFAQERIRGATRDFEVYVRGDGPPVVVLHELPGASPATFRLARLISDAGFRVYVPILFGRPGDYAPAKHFFTACFGSGGFDCWNGRSAGPIAKELVPLFRKVDQGGGVGAVGMCLTGTLPLELAGKGAPVVAAVVSQPAIPLRGRSALAVSDAELAIVAERKIPVVLARFSEDKRSPRERFLELERRLKPHVQAIEIDSSATNSWEFEQNAHAILTGWFRDEPQHPTRKVLDAALDMFRERLPKK